MIRGWFLALLGGLLLTSAASAQGVAWQFRWQPNQVLTYKVEQTTSASEVVGDNKVDTSTKLNEVKRWQVLEVDAAGVATLQLSLTSLRIETTTPNGDVLLFDSTAPDKSNPQMREQLTKYVGQPLAVLRVHSSGKVLEVKMSKHGPANRYESELPFVVILPGDGPKAGQAWERAYSITLEPPQGTGEKYEATQKYTCKAVDAGTATVTLTTVLKTQPKAEADQVPLLQMQPEGEVVFDTKAGCVRSVRLRISKELKEHQGEGSSYKFTSTYSEEYAGNQ